jgi:deoxyadenosine/deoxycytidine kinase
MKIGFCGTMSVGKTTLVNALKELPEFKDYQFRTERSKYLMELGIPLNTDSTIKGQIVFLAERASELMCENIITDRTIIDVMAFTKAAKSIDYHEADDFQTLAARLLSEYDYIFYVSPEGVEIEDNGVRETDIGI